MNNSWDDEKYGYLFTKNCRLSSIFVLGSIGYKLTTCYEKYNSI